jgi:hypothetical protein
MKKFTFVIVTLYIISTLLVNFLSVGSPINYTNTLGLISALNKLTLIFLVVPSVMITTYRSTKNVIK